MVERVLINVLIGSTRGGRPGNFGDRGRGGKSGTEKSDRPAVCLYGNNKY